MAPAAPVSSNSLNQSVVPGPPLQPTTASRPTDWPGGGQPQASPWPQASPADVVPVGEIKPCDGMRKIAQVGLEGVFESEVAGAVNEVIEANKSRIPADQLDAYRELLVKQRLKSLIETKLISQDAKRTIPAEGLSHFEKQLTKQFEEVELEKMMKKAEVGTPREFDQKLRTLGTSLEREKRSFIERTLAQQWVRQQIKRDEEITYDQMVVYYRDHLKEFTAPARAQWEELMVRYSKYPTKGAAFEAIARIGNQVFGGAPFADVAKTSSDGFTAADGGRCDWTSKGALVCQELDAALFNLPVGQLSPIIQGPTGYHIIRVIQRDDEVVRPFLEAQVDIKQKIIQQRSEKQFREYMAKLEARTPVWTIFDGKNGALQLATPPPPLRR